MSNHPTWHQIGAGTEEAAMAMRARAPFTRRRPASTLVLAAVVALVALTACSGGSGRTGEPIAVGAGRATTSTTATTTTDTTTPTTAPPDPTTTTTNPPPEVLIVGNSLVWLEADALTAAFAAEGVGVRFAGGSGTGLLTAQMVWVDEIEAAVARDDPDAVLIEACCNYGATDEHPEFAYTLFDGSIVEPDSELMYDLWADAAEQAARAAGAHGATVLWVVAPPVPPDHPLHDRIGRFNLIARNLAEEIPSLELVDWEVALTDDSGALMDPLQESDGTWVPMRIDGLHLSAAANALVIARTVDAVVLSLDT
jgi:hypothetical protein